MMTMRTFQKTAPLSAATKLLLGLTVACLFLSASAFSLPSPRSSTPVVQSTAKQSRVAPLRADAAAVSPEDIPKGGSGGGTATIPNEVFNLIKSIVGSGVLSLPAGAFLLVFVRSFRMLRDGHDCVSLVNVVVTVRAVRRLDCSTALASILFSHGLTDSFSSLPTFHLSHILVPSRSVLFRYCRIRQLPQRAHSIDCVDYRPWRCVSLHIRSDWPCLCRHQHGGLLGCLGCHRRIQVLTSHCLFVFHRLLCW